MHIAIDSSILRRDLSFSKTDALYLKELSKLKLVKLHFPWFVYQECMSHSINSVIKELDGAISSITGLVKFGLHKTESDLIDKIAESIELKKKDVENAVDRVWKECAEETSETIHDFAASDSKIVFDNYFKGGPPFSSLKKREDIPDAFIFQSLKNISRKKQVHFVVADNNLRKKCSEETNVTCYESYEELFKSMAFQAVLKKHDEIKKFEELKPGLITRLPEIEEAIEDHFHNHRESKEFEDRNLPSDGHEGRITGIEHIVETQLLDSKMRFIDGNFHLPVIVTADCLVEYSIYKADYYTMDDSSRHIHISPLNDHYYDAEESLLITFEFSIIIPKEDIEEELEFDFEINEFNEIYIGEENFVEVYNIDGDDIELKASVARKIPLEYPIKLENKVFKIQYPRLDQTKGNKSIQLDLYNVSGKKISKTINLEPKGEIEFKMDYAHDFMEEPTSFSFLDLKSNTDIVIRLSVFEYRQTR